MAIAPRMLPRNTAGGAARRINLGDCAVNCQFGVNRRSVQALHCFNIVLNMQFTILASAVLAPLAVLAAPAELHSRSDILAARQARPTKPAPCVRAMNTTEEQTAKRADAFAQAFIYKKDISEAFKYISQDYIVRES
ncbi:hypothetical protein IG631_02204 [Alternaria alternata]|nr:hypothetical protein IG631_02204 [Alternaria alternata]